MKKILSLIAAAVMVCAFGICGCGGNGDGVLLYEAKGGGYFVKGIDGTAQTKIIIPSKYNGLPVKGISADAFKGCTEIESVTLGANISEIGESAFAKCENLKSVSVGSIAQWCGISFADTGANPMYFAAEFYEGDNLVESLVIPDSVTEIPDFAFYESNIKSVKIGSGVTKIGRNAFYGCEQLASAEINGKVADMGELAFADCTSLKTLSLGNAEIIGEYAFLRCEALEEINVPASVKTIKEGAFLDCAGLKALHLTDGLKYIGECAFSGCISLTEFNIPSSVTAIGFGVIMFGGNYGFGGVADSYNQVGKIVLSDSLTEIPDFAFSYCGINTIVIGNKVTKINYSAFYGCELLESIVIPKSVTQIVSYAFYKCSMLNTVYYAGNAEEWSKIKIDKNGNDISNAEVYYYSETRSEGNYWHYVNGTPTKW